MGKALAGTYREKVFLATKPPVWSVQKLEDCDRLFDEQLDRLQTDRIDFYLLHCLQKGSWPKMRALGVLDWAERLRADGRIAHIGFSFHDSFEVFKEIVDGKCDDMPEQSFLYVGTLDEAREAAAKLKAKA